MGRRGKYFCLITALLAMSAGCSRDVKHGTVAGTVTLDGAPLKAGMIRFVPADGGTATADAPISEGKFSA